MDKFLQAELVIDQTEVVGYGGEPAEESHQKRSHGDVKRARPQSTEAGSSKKKTQQESVAEVPFEGTSSLALDPEPVHAGSEEDEGSKVPLLLRSRRTKGPAVVTVEALPGEVTERQTTGGDSVSASVPTKIVPSSSFLSQRMNVDPTDIQLGPSVRMMSSVDVLE